MALPKRGDNMAISPQVNPQGETSDPAPADDRVATTDELMSAFGQAIRSRRPRRQKGRKSRPKRSTTGSAPRRHRVEDLSTGYVEGDSVDLNEVSAKAERLKTDAIAKYGNGVSLIKQDTRLYHLIHFPLMQTATYDARRRGITVTEAMLGVMKQLEDESDFMQTLKRLCDEGTTKAESEKAALQRRIDTLREEFMDDLHLIDEGTYLHRIFNEPLDKLIETLLKEGNSVYGELNAVRIMKAQLRPNASMIIALQSLSKRAAAQQKISEMISEIEATRQRRINAFSEGIKEIDPGSYLMMLMTQPIENLAEEILKTRQNVRDIHHALRILRGNLKLDSKLMMVLSKLDRDARASSNRVKQVDQRNRGKAGGSKAAKKSKEPNTPKIPGAGPRIGKANPQGPDDPRRNRRGNVGVNAKGERSGTKGARRRSKTKK